MVGRRRPRRLEGRVALEEALDRFLEWELDRENVKMGSLTGVPGHEPRPVTVV